MRGIWKAFSILATSTSIAKGTFVNFYVLGGYKRLFFTTYMDALDKNGNVYDFSKVEALYQRQQNGNVNVRPSEDRARRLNCLTLFIMAVTISPPNMIMISPVLKTGSSIHRLPRVLGAVSHIQMGNFRSGGKGNLYPGTCGWLFLATG